MNFLRRMYLLLVSLLVGIVATILLLSPQTVATWVSAISELSTVIRILIVIVLDLILLALMYSQIRPDPQAHVSGLVMRGSGAITEVSVESARDRILKAVSDVPDVVSAEASVKPVRGRADIEMQVVVMGHDVRLPNKQKEINRALRQVIDKQLGLQMAGQPRIHIQIHGDEIRKTPLVSMPSTLPNLAAERAASQTIIPPEKAEAQPESLGDLLSEARREDKEKEVKVTKPAPEPVSPAATESETNSNPMNNLFGNWRRDTNEDEVVKKETAVIESEPLPEKEVLSPSPSSSIAALQPVEPDADLTGDIKTGEDIEISQVELDKEVSDSAADFTAPDADIEDEEDETAGNEVDNKKTDADVE